MTALLRYFCGLPMAVPGTSSQAFTMVIYGPSPRRPVSYLTVYLLFEVHIKVLKQR